MSPRTTFEQELAALRENMISMGRGIEQAFDTLLAAIAVNDTKQLEEIQNNDRKINEMERKIEAECLSLITRQQPVLASDLRLVSSLMKAVSDMERIGDHAADIAEVAMRLDGINYKEYAKSMPFMLEETRKILCDAVELFLTRDKEKAREFYKRDDQIDDLFNAVKEEIVVCLKDGKKDKDACVDLLMVAKYLERIGDHSVNISEWEVFKETGTVKDYRIL